MADEQEWTSERSFEYGRKMGRCLVPITPAEVAFVRQVLGTDRPRPRAEPERKTPPSP